MSVGDGIPVKGLGTAGTPDTNEVITVQGIGAGGGFGIRPYDSMVFNTPAGNTAAVVILPATPGKRWLLHTFTGTLIAVGGVAAAGFASLQIFDGVTLLFGCTLATQPILATGVSADRHTQTGTGYVSSVGASLTVKVLAGGANVYSAISVGAYQI